MNKKKEEKTSKLLMSITGITVGVLLIGILIAVLIVKGNGGGSFFERLKIRNSKVQVVCNYNLFVANEYEEEAIKGYNEDLQLLNITGSLLDTEVPIGTLSNIKLTKGDKYKITINYVGGSYKADSGNEPKFTVELQKDGANYSNRESGKHYVSGVLPAENGKSVEKILIITDDNVDATDFYYSIYQKESEAATFDNYRMQVLITKINNKIVSSSGTYGELPTPEKDGYTFMGWYDSLSGSNKIEETTKVEKKYDHKIYAHWEEGSGSEEPQQPVKCEVANCDKCDTENHCISCKSGYYPEDGECKSSGGSGGGGYTPTKGACYCCGTSSQGCTYKWSDNGKPGQYCRKFDTISKDDCKGSSSSACGIPNCASCKDGKCTKCISNNYELKDGKCFLKSSGKCYACWSGGGITSYTWAKDGVNPNATRCSEISKSQADCIGNTNAECGITNCVSCKDGKCTACSNDYKLENGKCVKDGNIAHCEKYDSSGKCTKCESKYKVSINGRSCLQCPYGCLKCDKDVNACEKCDDAWILVGTECVRNNTGCPEHCLNCQDGKCTKCKSGYNLSPDKTECIAIPEYSGNCKCFKGTYSGKCKRNVGPTFTIGAAVCNALGGNIEEFSLIFYACSIPVKDSKEQECKKINSIWYGGPLSPDYTNTPCGFYDTCEKACKALNANYSVHVDSDKCKRIN